VIELTKKGALYCADCAECGATLYSHAWSTNDDHDALQDGTDRADPETFQYAARYSAPGYLDWSYGANKREVKEMYGND
jgi:hypothetical protein